jgi:hypothetical protein
MALDDLPADSGTDACARMAVARAEALEDHEDPIRMFRRDADAVVAHGEDPLGSDRTQTVPEVV